MRKSLTTNKEEIVAYWMRREDECGLGVDWAEAHERCWRCGYEARLERCHIVPDSLGGSGDPSNLVLLCYRCHREAPNHANPRYMWVWLRADNFPFYDCYWTFRATKEFETMFGRKPFSTMEPDSIDQEQIQALMSEEFDKASYHLGQAHMNPVTLACIMADLEERLIRQQEA